MEVVQIDRVRKTYPLGGRELVALHEVSLSVRAGEFVILQGRSGSGKSTLLNIIGCVDLPTQGEAHILKVNTRSVSDKELSQLRRERLGFIFQTFNLLPVLSVSENIEYPLIKLNLSARERHERIQDLLHRVGLTEFAHHRPDQLSGGQRQRVAVARALVHRPQLIIADEPTANLDSETGEKIVRILADLARSSGVAIVMASHDLGITQWATRIVKVLDGRIVS